MGVKIARKKRRHIWLSFCYKLHKIFPLSTKAKLKFYLNMTWMIERLAQETSFKFYPYDTHPARVLSKQFIYKHLKPEYQVMDLGCSAGEISSVLAEKVNKVIGIDHDKPAIERAQKLYKQDNLEFYYGDAWEYLDKNKSHFDLLFLSHILEHLDNPKEFILKFKNFFDYIYIELPDFDRNFNNHYRRDLRLDLIYTDDDHVSEFDRYELVNLLTECDIEIVDSIYIYGNQQLWCRVQK